MSVCQALSIHEDIQNLEIAVQPLPHWIRPQDFSTHEISELLASLRMIRGVHAVTFSDAPLYPPNTQSSSKVLPRLLYRDMDLELELCHLLKSNTPVELAHMMFQSLLAYAQTFERHSIYRREMGVLGQGMHPSGVQNPLVLLYPGHLEKALDAAGLACWANDVAVFKKHRVTALKVLEYQYKAIKNAAYELAQYMKLIESKGGLSDEGVDDEYPYMMRKGEALVHPIRRYFQARHSLGVESRSENR